MTENNLICEEDGLQLAAVVNLIDNRPEDGGFMCWPRFHLAFDSWVPNRIDERSTKQSPTDPAKKESLAQKKESLAQKKESLAQKKESLAQKKPEKKKPDGKAEAELGKAEAELGSYQMEKRAKADAKEAGLHEWRRIPAPAGAVIIWNQKLVHGSKPNDSDRPRAAQFVKAIPTDTFTKERAKRRSTALTKLIATSAPELLKPLSNRAFGL